MQVHYNMFIGFIEYMNLKTLAQSVLLKNLYYVNSFLHKLYLMRTQSSIIRNKALAVVETMFVTFITKK